MQPKKQLYSVLLVFFQFLCLGFLLMTGPPFVLTASVIIPQVLGLALFFWAVASINTSTLNVFPVVRKNAKFVHRGPYRMIRHPMYVSLFLYFVPLCIVHFSWCRLAAILVLLIDLVIKIEYEEKLLTAKFPDYSQYRKTTYRLIPYIY